MNTFKKPFNPNIRKSFTSIIAPQIEEDIDKISKLFILVEQGNIAEVKKYILSTRVKLNAKFNDETILHKVLMIDDIKMSESKKLNFIDYLVSNGAFINSYNKFNVTPLHLAVQKKYKSIVKYFIEKKANINALTNENLTPLHYATLVNIDNCPNDNMAQDIIPDPISKNINYNEITQILVKAFMDNDTVDICDNKIIKYDENGVPFFKEDPYDLGSQDISLNIGAKESKILDEFKEQTKGINNLLKYNLELPEKIKKSIEEKIKDSKTIVANVRTEDILENIAKSEIDRLKKKFGLKQKFMDELSTEEYDEDENMENYNNEQKNIIENIYENIGKNVYDLLKKIINLKYDDISEHANKTNTQFINEIDIPLNHIFNTESKKKQFIDKLKQNLKINDEKELIKSMIKISIESISTEILDYNNKIMNIDNLLNLLTNESVGGIRDTRVTESIGAFGGLAALAQSDANKLKNLLKNEKNNFEYLIPMLLGLKIDNLKIEKIIQWYFRHLYTSVRRIFDLNKMKNLDGTNIVTSIYILFLFGDKYKDYIGDIPPLTNPNTNLYDINDKIFNIVDILSNLEDKTKKNIILIISLVYSINTRLDSVFNNQNIDFNTLNLFEDKSIPSEKITSFYNCYENSNIYFQIGVNLSVINKYVPALTYNSIILHKQPNYNNVDIDWNNFKNFYNEKNITQILSNNLFGASIIYGFVLKKLSIKNDDNDIKDEMNNYIVTLSKTNADTELNMYTQQFVINILKFLYKKVRQNDTIILDTKDLALSENNINGWVIDRVIHTEMNIPSFSTLFVTPPKPQIEFSNYKSRIPGNITGYVNNIYNDVKKQLPKNQLKQFIGLLDTQSEFLLNDDLILDANSLIDFQNVFDIYNKDFNSLIDSIPLKTGSIFKPAPGVPGGVKTVYERIRTILGVYNQPPPIVPAAGVAIGNGNNEINSSDFKSLSNMFTCIKKFRDIILNNAGNVLNNGDCYNNPNPNPNTINNFFQAFVQQAANVNEYSFSDKIKNIYLNNASIILSLLHFIFEEIPNPINIQIHTPILPNAINNNFLNEDFDTNVGQRIVGNNNINTSLLDLNFLTPDFENTKFGVGASAARYNLEEDNGNTEIIRVNPNPNPRTNFTDIPVGLLNLEQGLILSLIKQLGVKINTLFNEDIPDTNNYDSYKNISAEMKYYLELFLATLNVFYYYQLFCAIPCPDLHKKLQEQIIKFNKKIDEIKADYNINLPDDVQKLINKVNNIILEQKRIRTRSVIQVMCENTYLFNEILKKVILSNSVTEQAISMYDTANVAYTSLTAYKKLTKESFSIGKKYKDVHFDIAEFNEIIDNYNLNELDAYRVALESCKNLSFNLKQIPNTDRYAVSCSQFNNFNFELPIGQNFGLETIKLDDYNCSSFYLGFMKIFNDMYKKLNPNEINIPVTVKNILNIMYENNAPINSQQNILKEEYSDLVKVKLNFNLKFNCKKLINEIRKNYNIKVDNLFKSTLLYKIFSSFDIELIFNSIADAFKLVNKLPINNKKIYNDFDYIYTIIIGIFQSKLALKKLDPDINNLDINDVSLTKVNNNSMITYINNLLTQDKKDKNIEVKSITVSVPQPQRQQTLFQFLTLRQPQRVPDLQVEQPLQPYHDIFSIESALLALAGADKDKTKIYYDSNFNFTKFIAEKILEEIQDILKKNNITVTNINKKVIDEVIKISVTLSNNLKSTFIKLMNKIDFNAEIDKLDDLSKYKFKDFIKKLNILTNTLTKTVICFEHLFNGFINPKNIPDPIVFHNSLNLLPTIRCINTKCPPLPINELNFDEYNKIIKTIVQYNIFKDINSNPNLKLEDICLNKLNFNFNLDIDNCEPYILLDYYQDTDEANESKQKLLINMIDKDLLNLFISEYLLKVKNNYIFIKQKYYKESFDKLLKLKYPNQYKHELVRSFIYSLFEKRTIEYINNLINASIQQNLKMAMEKVISINSLQEIDFNLNNIIDIYLPSEDYSYNFASYTNNILEKVKDIQSLLDASTNLLDDNKKYLDYKLIEDEDYDIYNDDNFKNDVITINEIKKYYPIFYSYNYEGREVNKECVIIDYGLIEDLIKAGGNTNIKDQVGKTVIDYIIEGRMHYIIETDTIKERLIKRNLQYILEKSIKHELAHNNIFGYDISKNNIKLIDDYQNTLLYKLKNTDEIKVNVPINIKNIYKTYLLLQNIYWYRMLNKHFNGKDDYFNFFGINYESSNLSDNSDWKNIIKDIELTAKTVSQKLIKQKNQKIKKSTTLIEKNKKDDTRKYDNNNKKINLLEQLQTELMNKDYNYKPEKTDISLINESQITLDKSIQYFRKIYNNFLNKSEPPIMYTYMWDSINDLNKPYFIHLKMCSTYNEILSKPIIDEINEKSYSAISLMNPQSKRLNQQNLSELKRKINLLTEYMEPISIFIDGRMYENVLSSNPLLLFQVRTIVHILTTFLGSNLIMFIQKLLYNDFKKRMPSVTSDNIIFKDISNAIVDLKEYVTTDLLEDGYLSYEFIRLMLDFKVTDFDLPRESGMDELFGKIVDKIIGKLPLLADTEENSKLLENIRTNVAPYYQALYKEITIQLLNFSDSYYRFIKNQYAGILMINKSVPN
jgi:hypothetical protein